MSVKCGTGVRYGQYSPGSLGCLVAFRDSPERVMALTARHVVLPSQAKQNDPIYAATGQHLGILRGWTAGGAQVAADAAVVWVDPALVSPEIEGLGAPTGVNLTPKVGDVVRLCPLAPATTVRTARISRTGASVEAKIRGPNWSRLATYKDHILISPLVSQGGDSGSVVLDVQGRVVGMVVAGSAATNETVVTPIGAILNHPDFQGRMDVLSALPADAVSPADALTAAKAASAWLSTEVGLDKPVETGAGITYASLVPGGFFSADPWDLSVPRAIRTNNPGALNFLPWQQQRPGYVGKSQPDGSANQNVTTIYRTPEHGVASWFRLLTVGYKFGSTGSFSLKALAARYAGASAGPVVDNYVKGWVAHSKGGLSATSMIDAGDDAAMLVLARAMFNHEAGQESPLHDDQILYAMARERAGNLPN